MVLPVSNGGPCLVPSPDIPLSKRVHGDFFDDDDGDGDDAAHHDHDEIVDG